MEKYFLNYNKNPANENSSDKRTKQNRLIRVTKCAVCGWKKSRFIKIQDLHQVVFQCSTLF